MKYCDLVMKGGVASGVVYPPAVAALAREYTFRNIGGTSVGAIAAAAAAAAECGRRRGRADAFARLARLPDELARPGFLVGLFRPDRESAKLFDLLFALVSAKTPAAKAAAVTRAAVTSPVGAAAVVAVLVACLALWSTQLIAGSAWLYLALALLGIVIALGVAIAHGAIDGCRTLTRHGFGLCSGFDRGADAAAPRLTNWLAALVDELAGVDRPLTFGDLWHAPQDADPEREARAINLEMISSNVTFGRPYRFPLGDSDTHRFCFDPGELAAYFPQPVIDWMTSHPAQWSHPVVRRSDGAALVPLPDMPDLPVIVATRLSLSFPILFRAVPLYAVDFSRRQNQGVPDGQPLAAERCWFSDGGISSNFPIHFFDAPLPRWPTFAIDLGERHPEYGTAVWMPGERGGLLEHWRRFEDRPSPGERLFGFFAAMLDTALGWRDVMQAQLPAFRDRIVHVQLTEAEGGLHLDMQPAQIEAMSKYGAEAGAALLERFDFDRHLRVREWSALCALQDALGSFAHAYAHPLPQDETAWDSIRCGSGAAAIGGTNAQRAFACREIAALADIGERWQSDPDAFCADAPRPRPIWRVVPSV